MPTGSSEREELTELFREGRALKDHDEPNAFDDPVASTDPEVPCPQLSDYSTPRAP